MVFGSGFSWSANSGDGGRDTLAIHTYIHVGNALTCGRGRACKPPVGLKVAVIVFCSCGISCSVTPIIPITVVQSCRSSKGCRAHDSEGSIGCGQDASEPCSLL
jgi:hypothetical protein